MIALRDYQRDLIERIYASWATGSRRVMAQLPTGGGKTVIFSAIAHQEPGRVLVLAHRQELISQAAEKLHQITGEPVGIIKAGYEPDYGQRLQVASVQSLVNRLDAIEPPSMITIDESHHATAASYRRILEAYPEARVLGVSATPIRSDGSGFDDLFDSLICGPTVQQLIDQGYLCHFRLLADENPMQTGGARTRQGDYSSGDIAELNPAFELSANLAASYKKHCPGKRVIVFSVNVEHSQIIAARYQAAGVPAAHLDGSSSPEERQHTLERFKVGEIKVLCNCALFTEGFDLPELDGVQIARPTKSLALHLQMLGRALRPAPGKEQAILLDHTENWQQLGLPTRPRIWTLQGVEEPQPQRPRLPSEAKETEESALMVVLDGQDRLMAVDQSLAAEWRRSWAELVQRQQRRGYKPGWLIYQLKELQPPLEIWQMCGAHLGYKPGWSWHQWRATAGFEPA